MHAGRRRGSSSNALSHVFSSSRRVGANERSEDAEKERGSGDAAVPRKRVPPERCVCEVPRASLSRRCFSVFLQQWSGGSVEKRLVCYVNICRRR